MFWCSQLQALCLIDMPSRSLQDLAQCGVRLVLADTSDPDAVGFKQWRTAFYVAGETEACVSNFLLLLDGFLAWKGRQLAREQPFEVHLHPHTSAKTAAVDAWDLLEGCEYTRMQPAQRLPLKFFEAQPVQGKRIVTFRLELDDGKLSALIVGNTYAYRTKLDEAGVLGGYSEAENASSKTWTSRCRTTATDCWRCSRRASTIWRCGLSGTAQPLSPKHLRPSS
jgi:hypothetical protein